MPTPTTIQSCIDALTTCSEPFCFVCLAAQTSDAGTGTSFSVTATTDLPCLATKDMGPGQMFFVDSVGVPVISSCNEWVGLDGRVLRRDYPQTTLWGWGVGTFGTLGDGSAVTRSSPVREISCSINWCQISAGTGVITTASLALKKDGSLWTWGSGIPAQGTNNSVARCSPVREVTSTRNWCAVSAYSNSSSAVKTDGSLWVWGSNDCGQLGDHTFDTRSSPVREISSSCNWCAVSTGFLSRTALKTDGSLWTWGVNYGGQLGDNTTIDRSSPVREASSSTNWCQARIGTYTGAGIKTDGSLWLWGDNGQGQLLDNTTINRSSPVQEFTNSQWKYISVAQDPNFTGLKTNNTIWSWGYNCYGRLGNNSTTNMTSSPVQELTSSTLWCAVSSSLYKTTSALRTDGTLWSWGNNACGQLGDNTTIDRSSPVREITSTSTWCQISVGGGNTFAIKQIY